MDEYMSILDFFRKKAPETPKKEPINDDWRLVLAQCVVRIDTLEKQIAKLYLRQQSKAPQNAPVGKAVLKETETYIIYADGTYKRK